MLAHLKIKNYALIQSLDIDFKAGLNIITGETGTGKSILLGALGLILGNRAETSSLMDPEAKCIVEGRFQIGNYPLEGFFKTNDLDWDENTILRREISPNGKSRAFINDTPVNLGLLKEFGERLVDIHSQHQTLQLANPGFQVSLLDAFAQHKDVLDQYASLYKEFKKAKKELTQLKDQEAQSKKAYDYNTFQLNELLQANLQPGEMEKLEEELVLLTNAETIKQVLQAAIFELSDDERSINNQLASLKKQTGSIANLHPRLEHIYKRLETILVETKDIYGDIEQFQDTISVDTARTELLNERIRIISQLMNKHQLKSERELINYADELEAKVLEDESLSTKIAEIEKHQAQLSIHLNSLAYTLSQNRRKHVNDLSDNLAALLRNVGIPEATVRIELSESDALNEYGKDEIDILFSANKGAEPMPVRQVASGGELSRFMLCFKYILADSIFLPSIIFDEIDTGVSGEAAIKTGQMIKRLSANHQVICITHLPQVAAMGDHQYVVYKTVMNDTTVTHIRPISQDERVEEIAKMIAGHKPSAAAIENAKELLSY